MKKFQLQNKKYQVPTSWEECTLEMQMRVSADAGKYGDNETLQRISLISGYCNIPVEVLKKCNITKIGELFKHISFISEPLPKDPITEFEFKGNTYSVMNSLVAGEFQDFVSIETAFSNHKKDSWNALPIVLAILAKREDETLDDYDLLERAEHFKKLPLTIVEPLRVFFSVIGITSKLNTVLSSKEIQKKLIEEKLIELKSIQTKQVGGVWYMRLLRGMLRRYTKYFEQNVHRYFNTTQ